MDLVIVESPSKSKTISKYLGSGYKVLASGGHVRDLPAKKLAVNVHNNFEPEYEVYAQKMNTIKQLKKEVELCDKVYLATDPDREGEAISWHLKEILKIKEDNVRIVFNEITKKAVNKAIAEPHEINLNLVNSQQARRVLDRLVGYLISPVLSRKIKKGLSAGRVQSVALRMIADREREILAFKPEEFWNIFAHITPKGSVFHKSQFNDINGKKKKIDNSVDAMKVVDESKLGAWHVDKVKRAKSLSKANPPFTTSTMQQDGVNKLNMSAAQVMQVAQQLYEGVNIKGDGQHALVTYIRTDSVRVSDDAVVMAKEFITAQFGNEFYPKKSNVYLSKNNAQDAHEAIRPVSLEYTPESLKGKIESNQYRLYKLVYDRFLASQMVPAEYDTLNVHIVSEYEGTKYGYTLKGKTMTFAGYTIAYTHTKEDDDEEITNSLPQFTEGETLMLKEITHEQKFTKPPARYTDSSLVKAMEENGIGRPSTYASIISVLGKREYTEKDGKFMQPTELGLLVSDQLVLYFPNIMDTKFTAEMEQKLDTVEGGNVDWHTIIADFYPDFALSLEKANDGKKVKLDPVLTDIMCEKCGKPMAIRDGKFGKFLGCTGYPACSNIKQYDEKTGGIAEPKEGESEELANCPACGKPMQAKQSRYGKFYGCSGYPTCKTIVSSGDMKKLLNGEEITPEDKSAKAGAAGAKPSVPVEPKEGDIVCEKCGSVMVLKNGRFGEFYACPNYPTCKNIVNIKNIKKEK